MGDPTLDETLAGVTPAGRLDELGLGKASTPGDQLGRYVVLEEIGRGGMGRVLRAYDPKLQREVALKEVRGATLGTHGAARLVAEARAMAKLSHPNVVPLFDVITVASDRLVIVMEYVTGETLREWREQERPWRDVVETFVQAGRGLAAAHDAGLLHRDFKPANVLVGTDGAVKVTDFGLAKGVRAAASSSSMDSSGDDGTEREPLTQAGVVVGTPRYMAPEQHDPAWGERHGEAELGPAADQYAFCVALWEALNGIAPFSGKGLGRKKRQEPPAWPDEEVPRPIVEAIRRGLAPKPGDRWPSMHALLAVLRSDGPSSSRYLVPGVALVAVASVGAAVAMGSSEPAPCTGAEARVAEAWNDTRRSTVEAAMLGTDAAYADGVWNHVESELDRYAEDWARRHTEACEATTVRGDQPAAAMDLRMACLGRARTEFSAVVGVFETADREVVARAHEAVGRLPALDQCDDIEALSSDVQPPNPSEAEAVDRAREAMAEGRTEVRVGRFVAARQRLDAARAELADVEYAPVHAELDFVEATLFWNLAEYEKSVASLKRALESSIHSGRRRLAAESAVGLMYVIADRQQRLDEGLKYLPVARGFADDPQAQASLSSTLGTIRFDQGRYDEAIRELERAIELRIQTEGEDSTSVATSRNTLAIVLQEQGKYDEAEQQVRLAMATWENVVGGQHPSMAACLNTLSIVFAGNNDPKRAEKVNRRALAIWQKSLPPGHPHLALARNNLALRLEEQGRYEEAESELRKVVRSKEASLGPDHTAVATSRNNLALVLEGAGKLRAAEDEHRKALRIRRKTLPPEHPDIAQSNNNLALILLAQHRPEDALEFAEAAWTRRRHDDVLGPHRADTAFALSQALWPGGSDAQRRRARELAALAVRDLEASASFGDYSGNIEQMERWLRQHPEP